ncbi:MAG: multicopper oxidase family protein, partial [Cyanobacteria bacterium J06648_11]
MKRRQLFKVGAGGVGALALAQCARFSAGDGLRVTGQPAADASMAAIASSRDGLLDVEFAAAARRVALADREVTLLGYGGRVPGPRFEIRAGDRVRLNFTNRLTQPTNLHFHGLHVTPTGSGDNPFRKIAPGKAFTYEFDLPATHPGTLAWYHPHLHGTVAEQLFGGLAGLMVVRGAIDEIPEVKAAREEFLVLQDFRFDDRGQIAPPAAGRRVLGREGDRAYVNGEVNPQIAIASGALVRLRMVNASPSRFYRLQLEGHPFYLIGTDGGAIAAPVELDEILLVPGERVDVLVKGDRDSGQFRLRNLPYNRGSMGMMGGGMMGGMMGGAPADESDAQVLATLTYAGSVEPQPLPERLLDISPLPEPSQTRRFAMNHGMAPMQGMVFLMDGKPFDPDRVDTRVRLGDVEEWELVNTGIMDHPFHLHAHPFQVVSRNGQPEPYLAWKDTVLVPTGESARVRVKFADYPGKTVYHC